MFLRSVFARASGFVYPGVWKTIDTACGTVAGGWLHLWRQRMGLLQGLVASLEAASGTVAGA